MLGGLCAPALANTTGATLPLQLAYNDITIYPEIVTGGDSLQAGAAEGSAVPVAVPEPFSEIGPSYELPPVVGTDPVRIALLLPLYSEALRTTAEAVRAGFYAAYQTSQDPRVSITLVQTSDNARDIVAAYSAAAANHDVIVGPLTRSGVTALAASGIVTKPTIVLAQPEDGSPPLPRLMLSMGLSLEEEARQIAKWAFNSASSKKAFVIATNAAWQRRAARAFAQQWNLLGGSFSMIEMSMTGAYLDPNNLVALRQRVKGERPGLLFAALDAGQARQVREAIGTEIPLFGTSQVNPLPYQQGEEIEQLPFMEGIRLVDLPWQLQADHTAVMIYPRLPLVPGEKRNANMERFYALGIDAYRVAREVGRGRILFEVDGVTGKLRVSFGGATPFLERIAVPAVYREGRVIPLPNR